jgi:hypothetical protein
MIGEPLSLQPYPLEEEQTGQFSVQPSNQIAPLPPKAAEARAKRAAFAWPESGKPAAEYTKNFQDGEEDAVRQEEAAKKDAKKAAFDEKMIAQALAMGDAQKYVQAYLSTLPSQPQTDPKTVMEVAYADEFMSYLNKAYPGESTFWRKAQSEDPEFVKVAFEKGKEDIVKNKYLQKVVEEMDGVVQNQSWPSWGQDQVIRAFPGATTVFERGEVTGSPFFNWDTLGENKDEQRKRLHRLPVPEFIKEVDRLAERWRKVNPALGRDFLRAMQGQTEFESGLDTAFELLDASIVSEGTKLLKATAKGISTRKEIAKAVEDMKKGVDLPESPKVAAAEAAGDVGEASVAKIAERIVDDLSVKTNAAKESAENLVSGLKTQQEEIGMGATGGYRELVTRMQAQYENFSEKLLNTISTMIRVERVPLLQASEAAARILRAEVDRMYAGIDNAIMDIETINRNAITNTYSLTLKLGKNGTEYWHSFEHAKAWKDRNGLLDATIEKKGNGYFIRVDKPLDETNDIVKDFLHSTEVYKDPDNLLGKVGNWLAWGRTPDETLTIEQRLNRKAATYGPATLLSIAQEEMSYIRELMKGTTKIDPVTGKALERWGGITFNTTDGGVSVSRAAKERWQDWERIVKLSRSTPDPDMVRAGKTPEQSMGYFFKSVQELDNAYRLHFKRPPDEVEIQAYFAYKRLVEMDHMLRNLEVVKYMQRLGTEQHSWMYKNAAGETVQSSFINGMLRKTFPEQEATILVIGKGPGEHTVLNGKTARTDVPKLFKQLTDKVDSGQARVIQVYDSDITKFGDAFPKAGDKKVQFVIVDGATNTKGIDFTQVPRRGGGHFEYDYDFYIKQAKVTFERFKRGKGQDDILRHWYTGDTTIMPVQVRAMGKEVAQHLDDARLAIKAKNTDLARDIVENRLKMDWEEVSGWFNPHTINGEKIPARLSLDEKIEVVTKGESIGHRDNFLRDKYPDTFKDGTKQGSPARQFRVEYTGERDAHQLMSVTAVGSKDNPLYNYAPARMIDPIAVMDRSLSKMVNSVFMDDYKIFAVEGWLERASHYLKARPDEIRSAPFFHFHKSEFQPDTPAHIKKRLEAEHWQINQFLGKSDVISNFIDSTSQHIIDSVYGRFGPK